MRIIKITLIALLVLVGILFGITTVSSRIQGVNQGPEIQCASTELEVSVMDDPRRCCRVSPRRMPRTET